MAQRILVLRDDRQTVFPQLQELLKEGEEPLGRLHALWAIDGLGRASYEILVVALRDPDTRVQEAAVQISELFIKGHDPIVGVSVRAISKEAPVDLACQIVSSIRRTGTEDRLLLGVEKELVEKFASNPAMAVLGPSSRKGKASDKASELELSGELLSPELETWKFEASHSGRTLRRAFDGDKESRYATGGSQGPGMWIQVGFPHEIFISRIELDSGSSENDYPRSFDVMSSSDGETWSDPIASGKGSHPETVITFRETKTRFLRIMLTEASPGRFWSVHECRIYGKPVLEP